MTSERDLSGVLSAIPGVSSADVSNPEGGPPVARVYLDGTEPPDSVRTRIGEILGAEASITSESVDRQQRTGLGRGLAEVMSLHDGDGSPSHFAGRPQQVERPEIQGVAVIEFADRTTVEAKDSLGGSTSEVVTTSVDDAVIATVLDLLGAPGGTLVDIVDVDTDAGAVVVAIARDGEKRTTGSSFIELGRPWAVALAVSATLDDL